MHHRDTESTENLRENEINLRELGGSVVSLYKMAKALAEWHSVPPLTLIRAVAKK